MDGTHSTKGKMVNTCKILTNTKGKEQLGDLGIDRRIIIKWALK
jgi:hypothetical protein